VLLVVERLGFRAGIVFRLMISATTLDEIRTHRPMWTNVILRFRIHFLTVLGLTPSRLAVCSTLSKAIRFLGGQL
jgi:hypothetical protein